MAQGGKSRKSDEAGQQMGHKPSFQKSWQGSLICIKTNICKPVTFVAFAPKHPVKNPSKELGPFATSVSETMFRVRCQDLKSILKKSILKKTKKGMNQQFQDQVN